ncbi:FAD-dependent monooxygenase [Thalassovita taeanensis]|uniref:Salicylate hydroxylase n=1 Tax=Thalassovita taeanensis TaxID=657014 RepID=A0A1H9IZ34_9RHOB|nr:FAD-dependent monooxygenase [Thalassovita taeanensis]SEQ79863.1 salicylate hydroxylase [Thalassovita taeanensis]
MGKKILIAGGGIGGLAAAAGLLQAGHDVEVFEQAPELTEVGAGIQVSANATRVLYNLGLKKALDDVSVLPQRTEFRLHDTGEVISEIPLGPDHEAKFGAPYYHVYRPDILRMLRERVEALKPGCIRLNATVEGYEEQADRVVMTLKGGETVAGDLLIGADGIKSAIREQMHGAQEAEFTGQVAWRGMIPAEKLPDDFMPPVFINWMGPRRHMVVYWVNKGNYLNFVGCTEKPDWTEVGWTIKAPWEDLKADYEGFHPDVQTMLDAMDRDSCYCWALNIRPRLPFWSTERVTLLGDSCHPTIPYMAQGAVMAIEDGAVLVRALDEGRDLAEALTLYEQARIDRTARIVNESTAHAQLYHHDTHKAFRDAFADKQPAADRAKWLYNYDPLTVPLRPKPVQTDG